MDTPQMGTTEIPVKTDWLLRIMLALNELHSTVWGVFIVMLGVILDLHKQEAVGNSLVTGGFALISTGRVASTVVSSTNKTTEVTAK